MMFRMIAWDQAGLDKLREATSEAISAGQRHFFMDLSRKHKDVRFETEEAYELIQQLEADFAANPQPVYPENKEGREP